MLKKETLSLLDHEVIDYKKILSICIGKSYLFYDRLLKYIGEYKNGWNTDCEKGILTINDKTFSVEYIGSTSKTDTNWCSSEIEKVIPDEYVNLMIQTRKILESFGLDKLTETKIPLSDTVTGFTLSMIYSAFVPEEVACFYGGGEVSLYMFVKDLPDQIFQRINSNEFFSRVMEIISDFDVDHKIMVKALLCENDIEYHEEDNNIIAKFNEESILTIEFFDDGTLKRISGNISL